MVFYWVFVVQIAFFRSICGNHNHWKGFCNILELLMGNLVKKLSYNGKKQLPEITFKDESAFGCHRFNKNETF